MTDATIVVTSQTSGSKVRTVERNVGSDTLDHMQSMTVFKAGIQSIWRLYAQHLGAATITIPNSLTVKPDDSAAARNTQSQVLTEKLYPSSLSGVVSYLEKYSNPTSDNTSIISGLRFFIVHDLLESLYLSGKAIVKVTVQLKTSNASGTAYLQQITAKLRAAIPGGTPFVDFGTTTITVSVSTTRTDYQEYSFLIPVTLTGTVNISTPHQLILDLSTLGKISNASYNVYHKIMFRPEIPDTYINIPVEEALK